MCRRTTFRGNGCDPNPEAWRCYNDIAEDDRQSCCSSKKNHYQSHHGGGEVVDCPIICVFDDSKEQPYQVLSFAPMIHEEYCVIVIPLHEFSTCFRRFSKKEVLYGLHVHAILVMPKKSIRPCHQRYQRSFRLGHCHPFNYFCNY